MPRSRPRGRSSAAPTADTTLGIPGRPATAAPGRRSAATRCECGCRCRGRAQPGTILAQGEHSLDAILEADEDDVGRPPATPRGLMPGTEPLLANGSELKVTGRFGTLQIHPELARPAGDATGRDARDGATSSERQRA